MASKLLRLTRSVLLVAALVGCGSDDDTSAPSVVEQLEAAGIGQFLGGDVPTPTVEGDWLRYEFAPTEGGPVCLFGDPYLVFVRPGSNDKVQFYLEGGGACWNEATCFGQSGLGAKETADPIAPLDVLGGTLGEGEGNPLDGWNVVYVPYCDGSVFSGDNVVEYDSGTVYHRGRVNISAALDIMRASFPAPSEIVVSGSSAGGYGTFSGYGEMRVAYPDTPIYVLNDSGPGLQNNDDPQSIAERSENWDFERFIVEGCTRCDEQVAYLIDWALENDPDTRFALFSYQRDFVISDFLMIERTEYRDLLLDVSGEIAARNPQRFKRFLRDGESHTILLGVGLGPDFAVGVDGTFEEQEIDGTNLPDWIADFLVDGPEWRDLVEPEGVFVAAGEETILTFPDLGEPDRGSIDFTLTPQGDSPDTGDTSLVQIRTPHEWENRMQVVKNGDYLRFIVTDSTGHEADISYKIPDWVSGEVHRVHATWDNGVTTLYVDGKRVGSNTYPGDLQFQPNTPMHIGSDLDDASYGGAGADIGNFKIYGNRTQ